MKKSLRLIFAFSIAVGFLFLCHLLASSTATIIKPSAEQLFLQKVKNAPNDSLMLSILSDTVKRQQFIKFRDSTNALILEVERLETLAKSNQIGMPFVLMEMDTLNSAWQTALPAIQPYSNHVIDSTQLLIHQIQSAEDWLNFIKSLSDFKNNWSIIEREALETIEISDFE